VEPFDIKEDNRLAVLLLSALPKSSHSVDSTASFPAFSRPQLPQASGAAQCSCRSSQEKYALKAASARRTVYGRTGSISAKRG